MNEEQSQTEAGDVSLNPAAAGPVTLQVCSPGNRGKLVNSRFGSVEFDEDGFGEVTVPSVADIELLDQLQWLMPDDRRKFLGIREKVKRAQALDESTSALNTKIATLIGENTKLKNDNVVGMENLEVLSKRIEELESNEKGFEAKIEVLTQDNDKLKESLAGKNKGGKKNRGK